MEWKKSKSSWSVSLVLTIVYEVIYYEYALNSILYVKFVILYQNICEQVHHNYCKCHLLGHLTLWICWNYCKFHLNSDSWHFPLLEIWVVFGNDGIRKDWNDSFHGNKSYLFVLSCWMSGSFLKEGNSFHLINFNSFVLWWGLEWKLTINPFY